MNIIYSVIKKSELEGAERFDAEYYQPEFLRIGELLEASKTVGEVTNTYDLQSNGAFKQIFNILNDNNEKTIPYIRSDNAGDFFIDTDDLAYISKEAHSKLPKTQTQLEDIVMARKGKIGGATLITDDAVGFNSNDNIVNLKIKNKSKLDPYYFVAFFNSSVGLKQIERVATGNVQPWLSMFQLRNLRIFIPGLSFQSQIRDIVKLARKEVLKMRQYYFEAEELLLRELVIQKTDFEDELSYVVDASEVAQRTDAEYFQPKYLKLVEKLQAKGSKKLGDLVSIKKGIEPGAEAYQDEGRLFIRVSSVSKFGIRNLDQKYLNEDLYGKIKNDYQPQVGEILLTKDATPGIAYVVSKPVGGIISGGILRLKLKADTDAEYLALVINSLVGQMQAQRDAGGSVIKHWKPEQIKNIEIPILSKTIQEKVGALVRQSHMARQKSNDLLDQAKHHVEEIIESA